MKIKKTNKNIKENKKNRIKENNNKRVKEKQIKKFKKQCIIIPLILVGLIVIGSLAFFVIRNNAKENDICILQYNVNGGNQINSLYTKCGTKIDKPAQPKKEGFNFVGWFIENKKIDFDNFYLFENTTIEAKWEAKQGVELVVVSFDTTGGSEIKPIELAKGEILVKPLDPTLSGYKFSGWYYNYEPFNFSVPIYENITLKAKWELKNNNNAPIQTTTSSKQYKCFGSYRSDVPVKNVTVGYSDHVNWTWSTHGVSGGDEVCYHTYKTSDSSIATVSEKGIITTKKAGTVYISSCINDIETKKELVCFKGKLNIQDENDRTTVLSEYDTIANKYSGIWYLEGYSDIFITVSKYKMYYEAMDITPTQIDIINGGIYPNGYGNIQISYKNWNSDLKEYNVTLGSGYISIKTPVSTYKFTKKKGSKTKYSNSKFYEAIGTWYLYNKPEANFEIYKTGDDTDPKQHVYYCITPNSFDFKNLRYINASGGNLGCGSGTNNEILEQYGITISNGEMTITNANGSVKLYKTKKTVSVDKISLNKKNLTLNIGESETLSFTISPKNAYNQNVIWSSSDTSIATVNSSGKITAVGKGTTTIKVTTQDGNKTESCVVNVKTIDVTNITLNKTSLNLVRGYSDTLVATILPNNATNKKISWSSSDTSIAAVSSNGNVTAIRKGVATITVTTSDGAYTASCIVYVSNPELNVRASIGIKTIFSSSGAIRGVSAQVTASGGTGTYTYYYIKLYKDGSLIGTTTNTSSNELFVSDYTNGNYIMEYEVRDSDGTIKTGTANSKISGF